MIGTGPRDLIWLKVVSLDRSWSVKKNPAKSLNGAGLWILNGPGTKSRIFEEPKIFLDHFGAKKLRAPRKFVILSKGPF